MDEFNFSDGVSFLVFLSYVRHGLLGIWLALDVPRSLQHRPFLERLGLHAFLFGFIGFERTVPERPDNSLLIILKYLFIIAPPALKNAEPRSHTKY
jgi:hypothetical protein